MTQHNDATDLTGDHTIILRSPDELADALPYLMGFQPDDSVVLAATHGDGGALGSRVRLGLPEAAEDWPTIATQLTNCLIRTSEKRAAKPDAAVVYLCREPRHGGSGQEVMEQLRPFAEALAVACRAAGVPVRESLCISDGRYWSYLCPDPRCCRPDGTPMSATGTSVIAAAAAYAGLQVRGSLKDMEKRYAPIEGSAAEAQEQALDAAARMLVPRILDNDGQAEVADETVAAVGRAVERFRQASPAAGPVMADIGDDTLLTERQAATLIIGLQDRTARDRAAEQMEGDDGRAALRLWRSLARRCVGPYEEHATAPLTLAGWVAWSLGDEIEARAALCMALRKDPKYTFARLLHHAINDRLDPEAVRNCLRAADPSTGRGKERQETDRDEAPCTASAPDLAEPAHERSPEPSPPPKPLIPRQRRNAGRHLDGGSLGGDRTRRPRTARHDVRSPGSRGSGPGLGRRTGTRGTRSGR